MPDSLTQTSASASEPPCENHPGLALCAHGLEVRFGSAVALTDVTLDVPYGATVAVLGPNGSGKSTLFGAAVGLLRPAAGTIGTGDRGVAWLPQSLELEPSFPLTVRDVVAMGRWGKRGWLRRLNSEDEASIEAAMDALGLQDVRSHPLSTLSGGLRQRTLLAQTIAQDAGLVLLDEPLTGVDRPTAERINSLIPRWRDDGRTVMVATHDLEAAARDYDLVLALNGHVVAYGPATEVCTEEVLRETFSGHVARLNTGELVDTSHRHPGAA
jgi:ABC-type Mn2+/Zn2+ transport system ATPase subunit